MEPNALLEHLNDAQRQVVASPLANLLVLAGAGSGKTSVLVHRIAWLVMEENVSPSAILAVTFTNKAANEMRGRIEAILNMSIQSLWVGTFHSLAHRLLRLHWQEANLPESFQILDSDDQQRLIKRVINAMELDDKKWTPKQLQWYINSKKDQGLRPNDFHEFGNPFAETMQMVYQSYEEACERGGLVDFAELLLRTYEMLRDNEDLRLHYQKRFQHILVDEFQDTNTIQYSWIKLLHNKDSYVMAVGDDDQSIYSWRGANSKNIQDFSRDFPNTSIIRLEQNYRSTGNILAAANSLIANNFNRMGKNLWTAGGQGERIAIFQAYNEQDEAMFVADRIREWVEKGNKRAEVAILYRSNAQSRILEETLLQYNIPYRVYGGLRYFDRAEIKDALAYLRLIANENDDAAFERVVNNPPRGIGERTLMTIRQHAQEQQCSMWRATNLLLAEEGLTKRASNPLLQFIEVIQSMREQASRMELHVLTEQMIHQSTLYDALSKDRSEKGNSRLENLLELINATKQFAKSSQNHTENLNTFLAQAALETGEVQGDYYEDCVQLMTLHSAKGLEFPQVFMTGLEKGLFPHKMSGNDNVEEERRLCYVGMTRAMRKLTMTYAEVRRLYGQENRQQPSQFLTEIPPEYIEEIRHKSTIRRSFYQEQTDEYRFTPSRLTSEKRVNQTGYQIGQRVSHPKFGEGIVTNYERNNENSRLQVNFHRHGSKWLDMRYANLEAI